VLAHRWLSRVVAVRPEEVRALLWSFAYFFCLLAAYYILRPLRAPAPRSCATRFACSASRSENIT